MNETGKKSESPRLTLGTMYNLNKQVMKQMPFIRKRDFSKYESIINNFVHNFNDTFFMLYSKDISYFTFFRRYCENPFPEFESVGGAVMTVLSEQWKIYSIEVNEEASAIEIWICNNKEPICMYFYPYDRGIVEVNDK